MAVANAFGLNRLIPMQLCVCHGGQINLPVLIRIGAGRRGQQLLCEP